MDDMCELGCQTFCLKCSEASPLPHSIVLHPFISHCCWFSWEWVTCSCLFVTESVWFPNCCRVSDWMCVVFVWLQQDNNWREAEECRNMLGTSLEANSKLARYKPFVAASKKFHLWVVVPVWSFLIDNSFWIWDACFVLGFLVSLTVD